MYKKIIKTAQEVTLKAEEKQAILSVVSSFMKENPIEHSDGVVSPYIGSVISSDPVRHIEYNNGWSMLFILSKFKNKTFMRTTIIAALIFMLGGGTAFAANSSLPGDTLYPVKVHVNESLRSAFTIGTENKAKYESELAQTRLEEAEKLAARGQINESEQAAITANFNEHANNVKNYENEMNTSGKTEEASSTDSQFKAMLSTHDSILTELSQNDSKDSTTIGQITGAVGVYLTGSANVASTDNSNTSNNSNNSNHNSNSATTNTNVGVKVNSSNSNTGLNVTGTASGILNTGSNTSNSSGSTNNSSNSNVNSSVTGSLNTILNSGTGSSTNSSGSTNNSSSSSSSASGNGSGSVSGILGL